MANIDVIIPGLFQLPPQELNERFLPSRLPSLNHILRYSTKHPQNLFEFEPLLADSLGLTSVNSLPFASAFESRQAGKAALLCEAVHLKPDMHNAYILPLDKSDTTNKHISLLINDISSFFKVDFNLSIVNENIWLMELHQCPAPRLLPHSLSVIGRKADPYIKQSREVLDWYQLINEVQMFMHSHEVNQQRIREGQLTINSLWCWGSGEPLKLENRNINCFCDDYITARFLENAGLNRQKIVDIERATQAKRNICIDLGLLQALKTPSGQDLVTELERIETVILRPLLEQVQRGQVRLRLRTGHNTDFEIGKYSTLKFWRKPVSIIGASE